jgi:hypothetical protein
VGKLLAYPERQVSDLTGVPRLLPGIAALSRRGVNGGDMALFRTHPATAAYHNDVEPALCLYGRSLERR